MKRRLRILLLTLLLLCGCTAEENHADVTETIPPEQIWAMLESAEESLRAVQPTTPQTTAAPADTDTVYWSPGGSVWHLDPTCPSLKQAKSVRSGSITDARAAGKARACKTCGE